MRTRRLGTREQLEAYVSKPDTLAVHQAQFGGDESPEMDGEEGCTRMLLPHLAALEPLFSLLEP